eukprot:1157819-Pelagomonas_calceolata.AAC.3
MQRNLLIHAITHNEQRTSIPTLDALAIFSTAVEVALSLMALLANRVPARKSPLKLLFNCKKSGRVDDEAVDDWGEAGEEHDGEVDESYNGSSDSSENEESSGEEWSTENEGTV